MAAGLSDAVTWLGYRRSPYEANVWVRGDIAWERIIGSVALIDPSS
jgi:hypothetical protein